MPLQVTCPECGKVLRVPDGQAGKRGRCPVCKVVVQVPESGATVEEPAAQVAIPPPAVNSGDTPGGRWYVKAVDGRRFGPLTRIELDAWVGQGRITAQCQIFRVGAQRWQWAGEEYPHLAAVPAGVRQAESRSVADRVAGPANALLVIAILGLVLLSLAVVAILNRVFSEVPVGAQQQRLPFMFSPEFQAVTMVLSFCGTIVVLFGALSMKGLKNYGFVVTASIIAMLPYISPCCLFGLPFGIWALCVLNDNKVRDAFTS